ncbi:MAG TPA: LysM domain-containing protein [Methylocystis sp.]|nr:LysM domain-containing protein [Methylocystis sp.]
MSAQKGSRCKRRPAPRPAPSERYTVVKGDSPWRIALKLCHDGSRWREIVAANPGFDFRRLRPGQALLLPESVAETKSCSGR